MGIKRNSKGQFIKGHSTGFGFKKGNKMNVGKNNPMFGKFGKDNPSFGSHQSKTTKKKISKSQRKRLKENPEKILKGKNHPNWIDGEYISFYSVDWTETLKRSIRERDRYTCQLCGALQSDIAFQVHHIDYDKKNCNPINLITLCNSCHGKTNFKRKKWTKYFQELKNTYQE